MKKVIAAHDEWVAEGDYTIEGDITLCPNIAREIQNQLEN